MSKIKVIKNFLTPEECDFYIKYIESNFDKFQQTEATKRFIWLFGDELSMGSGQTQIKLNLDLNPLADIETKIRNLFTSITAIAKDVYKDQNELYVTSFSMTKQIPGAYIPLHYDTDGGVNHYFKYSGIIYLNAMKQDGILEFPRLGYSHSPEAGDFVMFPSADPDAIHQVIKISEDRYSFPLWLTEDSSWKI